MTLLRPPETQELATDARRRPAARTLRTPPLTRQFRPDIEGLRAIAVVTVVLYHADLGFSGGYVGVDVFFVISGFLITRQLTRSVDAGGAKALPTFYAHRIRRLLPAAAAVVVATVVAARIWAPALQVGDIAGDAIATTFYGLNYRLAIQGTDYQHMGTAASPLQHFWSLAVEEQFYLLWPLLVVAIALLARRRSRAALVTVVVSVVAVSAVLSWTTTAHSAPWAYFSLHTRAWELGIGALVALTAPALARIPRRLGGLLATVGLLGILASAVLYDDQTPFPGTAAWVPVGGAALVVAAGCGTAVVTERFLGEPLMQCLGKVSYSWYLWHWPFLVLVPLAIGAPLSALGRAGVVWVSLAVAILSFLLIEEPARRWRAPSWRWYATGLGVSSAVAVTAATVIVLAPSSIGDGAETTVARTDTAAATVPAVMASAITDGADSRAVPSNLTPQPTDASDSIPATRDTGCHAEFTQVEQGDCAFGDTSGTRTVVLFGDSHMEQWLPAFESAGETDRWKVVSWTKSACPPADVTVRSSVLNRTYTECDEWRARTIERIQDLDPDLVVVSQAETVVPGEVDPAEFATATARTVERIATGIQGEVRYLHDIPIPGDDLPQCVADNLDDAAACAYDRSGGYSYPDRHRAIAPALGDVGVETVDTVDWFCADDTCPAIVGNLLVYRDDSHMTVPYSTWLTPMARGLLADAARAEPAPRKEG